MTSAEHAPGRGRVLTAASPRLYRAEVARTARLSPHLLRVSFAGPDLTGFPDAGPDQRVKLLLPLPGQDRPCLDGVRGARDILALPDGVRPVMRTYTVRRLRPGDGELDIDFVRHSPAGPASRWTSAAAPGDQVAIFGPAITYRPGPGTTWQLVAGDETALPAIGAITESLPPAMTARVLIEIADARDIQHFSKVADANVTWLVRGTAPAHDSRRLLDEVRLTPLPRQGAYAWLAGEASVVTGLRRHLVEERGLPADAVAFSGYWRHGRAENDV